MRYDEIRTKNQGGRKGSFWYEWLKWKPPHYAK